MKTVLKSPVLLGLTLALTAVGCWGTMFPIGRLVFSQEMINPYTLCGVRFLLAGLIMIGLDWGQKGRRAFAIPFKSWLVMAGAGSLALTHIVLLSVAQKMIPAVNASMIEAMVPIQIFILSLCCGASARWIQIGGLAIGFVGCLMTLRILDFQGFHLSCYSWGDGLIFLSALCWSAYIVWGRATIRQLGSWTFTGWSFFFGGALLVPFMILTPQWVPWVETPTQWRIVAYYLLIPTILGFVCWNSAQKYLSLGTLSFLAYFNPLVAANSGMYIVHEFLTWEQLLGAVLIIGAALTEIKPEP